MAWDETTREGHKRCNGRYKIDLTDAKWAVLESLIPLQGKMGCPRELDMRDVVDAVQ